MEEDILAWTTSSMDFNYIILKQKLCTIIKI